MWLIVAALAGAVLWQVLLRQRRTPGDASSGGETARDIATSGARPRSLQDSDLSPSYRAQLRDVFASDGAVSAAWVLWVDRPDGPPELAISVRSEEASMAALTQLCERVDALGGPSCFATFASGQPAMQPFYQRDTR